MFSIIKIIVYVSLRQMKIKEVIYTLLNLMFPGIISKCSLIVLGNSRVVRNIGPI